MGALTSGTQHNPRIRLRTGMAKKKKMVKEVYKLIETKRTPSALHVSVHPDFSDNLDLFMLAGIKQDVEEVGIQTMD